MAQEIDKTFTGRVVLDDNRYQRCVFSGATLVFYGGSPPVFEACTFEGCQWSFNSSAGNTLNFLRGMAHAEADSGFRTLFDQIFARPSEAPP